MRYRVTVGGRSVEVDLSGAEPRVDGRRVRAELRPIPVTGLRHLMIDDRSYTLTTMRGERSGTWRIILCGIPFEAEAVDERTRALREISGVAEVETEKVVRAPMPGLIVRIHVAIGDVVKAGDSVAAIEAMKMENELTAPTDGVVARIEVTAGQAVEKGSLLMVFE